VGLGENPSSTLSSAIAALWELRVLALPSHTLSGAAIWVLRCLRVLDLYWENLGQGGRAAASWSSADERAVRAHGGQARRYASVACSCGICNASARGFRKMSLGMGWRGPTTSLEPEKKPTRAGVSPRAGAAGCVGASQGDTTMRRPYEIWAAISGGIFWGAAISGEIVWGARSGERQNHTVWTPTHRAYRVVEIRHIFCQYLAVF
jgi:hypothetical protein